MMEIEPKGFGLIVRDIIPVNIHNNGNNYPYTLACILRNIIEENENRWESGEVSIEKLKKDNYYNLLIRELCKKIADAWTYNPALKNKFLAVKRQMLIQAASMLLDILVKHDIEEDEASREE